MFVFRISIIFLTFSAFSVFLILVLLIEISTGVTDVDLILHADAFAPQRNNLSSIYEAVFAKTKN